MLTMSANKLVRKYLFRTFYRKCSLFTELKTSGVNLLKMFHINSTKKVNLFSKLTMLIFFYIWHFMSHHNECFECPAIATSSCHPFFWLKWKKKPLEWIVTKYHWCIPSTNTMESEEQSIRKILILLSGY